MEQGSDEWKAIRLGKVTASRVADVVAKTKTGWSASRANYRAQLVAERLTGILGESYTNAAMEWGVATEAEAREAYCFYQNTDVEQIAFAQHPTIAMSGASPDGLIGTNGLVEIKCPNTATHIETLLGKSVPGKYALQMQWQMACTDRSWCDFVSYDPRMPEDLRLFVKRLERDEETIAGLSGAIVEFLQEVDETIAALNTAYRRAA
jgi:putative phage-type endonuclease